MKRAFLLIALLLSGAGVGAGAAYGVTMVLTAPAQASVETAFVPTGPVLAPLVFPDGRLVGYVSFEVQLQIPADQVERVTERMPLLLHAINLRTFRTPMTSGPDGQLPNIHVFRRVVQEAAPQAFGPGVVSHAAITSARPA